MESANNQDVNSQNTTPSPSSNIYTPPAIHLHTLSHHTKKVQHNIENPMYAIGPS